MKIKKRLWEFICLLGIPWIVITIGVCIGVNVWYTSQHPVKTTFGSLGRNATERPPTTELLLDVKTIALITGGVWLIVFLKNLIWVGTDKKIGLFTWLEPYNPSVTEVSARKRQAQYPNIPEEYLSVEPDGLVLGKRGKDYVRVLLKKGNILNAVIMGSAGTGKSALLLTTLLYQFHKQRERYESGKAQEPNMTVFALDIKPELACKSVVIRGNQNVKVMNPEDRSSYGWDPFYNITPETSDDDIMSELDLIARALIDAGKDGERNEFFYQHARTIAKAVLYYTYKEGRTFMQGLRYLMDGKVADVLQKTLTLVDEKVEYGIVKRLLAPYVGKEGEAFEGIELAFRQSLDIFQKNSIQFFLDGNPRKASPNDLEERISVFFSIPETRLEEYKYLLRLVTMQIMHHCSGRSENSHMITLIIDEAARLGSINWTSFLSTSRSRQVATILAFQSLSQMQKVWSKEDAKSMIELCRIIAVLSCKDPDAARMLSDWVGDYKEQKKSINQGGRNSGTYSISYEDKKIIQPSDIFGLQEKKEVILFIKGQYMRANVVKARYYKNRELNEISRKCVRLNDAV